MKIGVVQMQASNNLLVNLNKMKQWVEEAAKNKADLIVFPEMAYLTGGKKDWLPALPKYEDIIQTFKDWARAYQIAIVPGTVREPMKTDVERYFNTLLFIQSNGQIVAKYRKIFLYKADLPGKIYNEPEYCEAGTSTTIYEDGPAALGFSICFDLRFPEMFRHLKKHGAQVVLMPSAFTVPTGMAHWEPLIRARAIENQFFMIAPGLVGTTGDGAKTYGHSLVVNPWGEVLLNMGEKEGLEVVDVRIAQIKEASQKVPAWDSRREDIFPIR